MAVDADKRLKWQDYALCAEVGPDLFLPEDGASAGPAKSICAECPVIAQCLELGMKVSDGIFGGLTPKERRRLRKAA